MRTDSALRSAVDLGEVTRRAQPLCHLLKKREIQIDLVIAGAIEGAHGG
jgi:hypothetical protein